jgi:hypothetical protein
MWKLAQIFSAMFDRVKSADLGASAPVSMVSRLGLRRRSRGGVSPDFDRRVVWIFGSPRSGSTWLLYLLAEHPSIVPVNEPLIGSYLGPFMSDLPGIAARDLVLENFTLRRIHHEKRPHFFADEFADVWLPGLGSLMRERFSAHIERYPPAAGAERALAAVKEPNGSQSADLLMRAMPGSRLLFLLRDGRDVVDSELAANAAGSWIGREFPGSRGIGTDQRVEFVTQSAMKWLWRTQVVQDAYRDHRGPKLMVRYEDLRADPLPGVREIFDWLELEVDDGQLAGFVERHEFERVPEEKRGADQFHRAASPGLWRENLGADEQQAIEDAIGPKLRELGYPA